MIDRRMLRPALVAALLFAAAPAIGAPAAPPNDLPMLNGGSTKDEADLMRQAATRYPFEVTLARRGETAGRNDFVADAQLRIIDEAGHVVVQRTDTGPIFLASLPDGTYTVEATYAGQTKTQRVQVSGGRHANVTFLWD